MKTQSDDAGDSNGSSSGDLTLKALDGLVWLLSSSVLQSLLGLVVLAILARLLLPSDFGLVAAAHIVLGFAQLTSQLGVGAALVQLPTLDERHVRTGFTFSFAFGLLLACIMWLLSPFLAQAFRLPELAPVIQLLTWMFPLQAVSSVSSNLIQRDLNYRRLAGVDVASYSVGYGGVSITLALLDFGVWALVWGSLAQSAIAALLYFKLQPHSVRPQWNWPALRELLSFGSAFTISGIFNYLARKGDSFVVGRWLGAGALGIYNRAYGLMNASNSIVGQVVNKVFFPAFAKIQDDKQRLSTSYRRSMGIVAFLMFPTGAICWVLAPEIVDVLLGDQWHDVILPFQILAVGMFFRLAYKMGGTLVRGVGAVQSLAWCQATYATFAVAGAWVGHHWGVPGVACSTLIALGVQYVLVSGLALRFSGLSLRSFLHTQSQAIFVAGILFASGWGCVVLLRAFQLPSVFRLTGTLATLLIVAGLLLMVSPRFVFGRDGLWLLKKCDDYLPDSSNFIIKFVHRRIAVLLEK
jgi:teichuronic acid exporter